MRKLIAIYAVAVVVLAGIVLTSDGKCDDLGNINIRITIVFFLT